MQIKTPVYDFVTEYLEKDMSRLHMPGHKGQNILGCEARDITEIEGADYLLDPDGIITESEAIASHLFDTACTIYSTEGSTLAMKAMLRLAMMCSDSYRSNRKFRILAARNVHESFVHACALLDIDAEWLYGEDSESICQCRITPEGLRTALDAMKEKPDAVFVTSPDYLGNMADIHGLAEVCHERDILVLVDNAHGAYLHFLPKSLHPIDLGADLCCDSAHKTLPVLTGGAYLHISKRMAERYDNLYRDAKRAMSLFSSTSPSYLILQSLDLCNAYLANDFRKQLNDTCHQISALKDELDQYNIHTELYEPLKLLVDCASLGLTGTQTAAYLRNRHIECEYADHYDLVLMITPQNDIQDLTRIKEALKELSGNKTVLQREFPILPKPKQACSIREAILSPSVRVPVEEAEGLVCASASVSYPPAVPVAISGELITEQMIHVMKWYGIQEVDVIKR
ncbi:MAG: PLP-dependent transferase [Solobacterium sp.]|nr:PLP-dependent transferase [Solobacterium sp.]